MSDMRGPIATVLHSRPPTIGSSRLLGIDGHGGSGKSTLAEIVAAHLGAEVIHTDDFASWDNPKDWRPRLIDEVLLPLAQGARELNYERSQWWPDHKPSPVVDQQVAPIMVLEGVGALRKEFRPFLTAGGFVKATREVCMRRGIQRDSEMGTPEDVRALWERYFADEESYMHRDRPEEYADVAVDGTQPFEPQL